MGGRTTTRRLGPARHRRSSLAVLAAVLAAPALASAPAAAAEEGTEQEVEVTDTALYAASVGDALPSTLTRDVPPEALCVLEPQLCPQELDPVRTVLRDVVGTTQQVPAEPIHPIPPDTVAVSYLAGKPRYQSALRFAVPAPPADDDYGLVELVLAQSDPTYHLDSPAFRRVVLGTFAALGEQDPQVAVDGVVDALEREDLVGTEQVMGIEACPLTEPFEPGGAPFAQPDDDIPRSSEDDESPAVDCLFGSDGQYDEDEQVWRFDLTMAAAAWHAGELDNHGILLQPSGAPNLAFGDPDTSTNAQVVLDVTTAVLGMAFQPPLPPVDTDGSDEASDSEPPPDDSDDGFGDDGFDDDGFDAVDRGCHGGQSTC
jgi:hypothetical protein